MVDDRTSINDILEDFPFSTKSDQLERLTDFFVANAEGNQEYVYQKTGISQPTIRKIKENYEDLSLQEKALLTDHVASTLHNRTTSNEG